MRGNQLITHLERICDLVRGGGDPEGQGQQIFAVSTDKKLQKLFYAPKLPNGSIFVSQIANKSAYNNNPKPLCINVFTVPKLYLKKRKLLQVNSQFISNEMNIKKFRKNANARIRVKIFTHFTDYIVHRYEIIFYFPENTCNH